MGEAIVVRYGHRIDEYSRGVSDAVWTLDASDGELVLRTGVVGRAARLGHRLTIAMTRWQALVNWSGTDPVAGELVAEVDSFEVMRGEGGTTCLPAPPAASCGPRHNRYAW